MPQKCNLSGIHLTPWSTKLLAFGFGRSKPGPNAIPDQFSLELGDAGKDSENQSSIRRRSVYTLVQADKVNPERPKLVERVHELPEAPGEPVVAINHHAIDQAFAACDAISLSRASLCSSEPLTPLSMNSSTICSPRRWQ
jgi:hypothetical protein